MDLAVLLIQEVAEKRLPFFVINKMQLDSGSIFEDKLK